MVESRADGLSQREWIPLGGSDFCILVVVTSFLIVHIKIHVSSTLVL